MTLREQGVGTGVGPHVPLQFVGVSAGIAAQAALERALPGVRTDVAFQFANLEAKGKAEVSTEEQASLPKPQETSQECKAVYIYLGTKPNKHISVPFSHCIQPLAPAHSTSPPCLAWYLFLHSMTPLHSVLTLLLLTISASEDTLKF